MRLDDIFRKRKKGWQSLSDPKNIDEQKLFNCPECKNEFSEEMLRKNFWICPKCEYYFKVAASDRIQMLCDEGSFQEKFEDLITGNPLDFPEYEEKISKNIKKTGNKEAFIAGKGKLHGIKVAFGVLDSQFLMGSMGTVVGEKICRLAEYAMKRKLPLIIVSASGGARMQEGLFSLMQMANTTASIEKFKHNGGLFLSILTNPTTGGVSASYASLGDIIWAEPEALIGFAGPRVIQQTIGETLPEGFQRAEFLLEHGMIDGIVPRREMKGMIYKILRMH